MSDYIQRQDHLKARYLVDWREMWGKLTAEQREEYKRRGITGPSCSEVGNRNEQDISEMSLAAEHPDIAKAIDTMLDSWLELTHKMSSTDAVEYVYKLHCDMMDRAENIQRALILERMVRFLVKESNVRLAAIGLALAAGLECVNGKSMTQLAVECCCSRAAISKIANRACDALQLPRSRYMKSKESRKVYSNRAKQVHRKQKGEAR